uniref:Uncharacterized protein n=1 Tax=Megaselia scalaris TaxID=36166 RepID=T1GH59_MEGSC
MKSSFSCDTRTFTKNILNIFDDLDYDVGDEAKFVRMSDIIIVFSLHMPSSERIPLLPYLLSLKSLCTPSNVAIRSFYVALATNKYA